MPTRHEQALNLRRAAVYFDTDVEFWKPTADWKSLGVRWGGRGLFILSRAWTWVLLGSGRVGGLDSLPRSPCLAPPITQSGPLPLQFPPRAGGGLGRAVPARHIRSSAGARRHRPQAAVRSRGEGEGVVKGGVHAVTVG